MESTNTLINATTSFKLTNSAIRNYELLLALCCNILNDTVSQVSVYTECLQTFNCLNHLKLAAEFHKLYIKLVESRPPVSNLLETFYEKAGILCLYNSDIILPAHQIKMPADKVCLACGRWEINVQTKQIEPHNVPYSQDCWFLSEKPPTKVGMGYYLGLPGADNRFAFELEETGFQLINPVNNLILLHVHTSQFRTRRHKDIVPEPYRWIHPERRKISHFPSTQKLPNEIKEMVFSLSFGTNTKMLQKVQESYWLF